MDVGQELRLFYEEMNSRCKDPGTINLGDGEKNILSGQSKAGWDQSYTLENLIWHEVWKTWGQRSSWRSDHNSLGQTQRSLIQGGRNEQKETNGHLRKLSQDKGARLREGFPRGTVVAVSVAAEGAEIAGYGHYVISSQQKPPETSPA